MKTTPTMPQDLGDGFSRVDLLAVVALALLAGCWLWFSHSGERGRIARCQANLATLGRVSQAYANDHEGGLPAAGIDLNNTPIVWDMTLASYLKPGLAQAAKSVYDKKQLMTAMQPSFYCPSDPGKRGNPRSYAICARNMAYGWPPTPYDKTGIGLWWDQSTIPAQLGPEAVPDAVKNPDSLPKLKTSLLPDPANTLLLTELITGDNRMGSPSSARIWNVNDQQNIFKGKAAQFHFGKFNYLMADGHVELFTRLQTGETGDDPAGIWTIKAGD